MARNILLTGGTGMVGRNVSFLACRRGIDIDAPTHSELNLLDFDATRNYIKVAKPEFVIHAAGIVGGIQANMAEPVRHMVENWDMSRNLLLAAAENDVERLITLGSSCMYPRDREGLLHESDMLSGELEPTNEGFAIAKIATSKLTQYLQTENESIDYKTIIPCNLYGPGDKFSESNSHLFAAIIHKLHQAKVNGYDEVEIWGEGLARREFVFAEDLADALLRALDNYDTLPKVMNIGAGEDRTVNEYYSAVAKVIGYKGRFVHDLSKPVGMARKLLDVTAATEWGWQPTTTLADGIALAYEYYLTLPVARPTGNS
jgi:GDP-L-fucose synthase